MKYLFNNKNKFEYLGTYDTELEMPDICTEIKPPEYTENTIPCFNINTKTWDKIISDYRGKIKYVKNNSLLNQKIYFVGDIENTYTLIAPPDNEKRYCFNDETNYWYEYVQPVTIEDYDNAMEEHLDNELKDRGYTKRSPIEYKDSTNERWKQDAIDWNTHLTEVMEYGLSVINDYKEGKTIPTLDEFKKALPKITWTVQL